MEGEMTIAMNIAREVCALSKVLIFLIKKILQNLKIKIKIIH